MERFRIIDNHMYRLSLFLGGAHKIVGLTEFRQIMNFTKNVICY